MSEIFKCRMPEYDGEDEWHEVSAYDAEDAAEVYSDHCDADSAMERFEDDRDNQVEVKDGVGIVRKYTVNREYNPYYSATEIDPAPTKSTG